MYDWESFLQKKRIRDYYRLHLLIKIDSVLFQDSKEMPSLLRSVDYWYLCFILLDSTTTSLAFLLPPTVLGSSSAPRRSLNRSSIDLRGIKFVEISLFFFTFVVIIINNNERLRLVNNNDAFQIPCPFFPEMIFVIAQQKRREKKIEKWKGERETNSDAINFPSNLNHRCMPGPSTAPTLIICAQALQ